MDLSEDSSGVPLFAQEELAKAVSKLPSEKTPGPDLIPNELIKLAYAKFPAVFWECFNACLTAIWKRARLVLLHKSQGKPREVPSSYRPISLLDGTGKVFERLLLEKLNEHIEAVGALSDQQFDFRRSRSTTHAIEEVLQAAEAACRGSVRNRNICIVITLDVKNAFNSTPWRLKDAAQRRYIAPDYLVKVLRSYMSNRELLISKEFSMPVTCGVPEGSVLVPLCGMFFTTACYGSQPWRVLNSWRLRMTSQLLLPLTTRS